MNDDAKMDVFGPTEGGWYQFGLASTSGALKSRPDNNHLLPSLGHLTEVVSECCETALDWDLRGDDERDEVLDRLRLAGYEMLSAISEGGDRDDICAELRKVTFLCARTAGANIPWEFLYLGQCDGEVVISDFLGARAVVARPFEVGRTAKPVNDPGLLGGTPWDGVPTSGEAPFGLAQDDQLGSVKSGAERDIFLRCGRMVSVLPDLRVPRDMEALGDFLAASTILTHFNCHADDNVPRSNGKRTSALRVTDRFVVMRDDILKLPLCPQSIVVLNCCNGITLRWDTRESLADAVAKRGAAAVVATTNKVPDGFATTWANAFYEHLVTGRSVGDAIMNARTALLERDRNPMALLYGFMGRYEARLPQAVPA